MKQAKFKAEIEPRFILQIDSDNIIEDIGGKDLLKIADKAAKLLTKLQVSISDIDCCLLLDAVDIRAKMLGKKLYQRDVYLDTGFDFPRFPIKNLIKNSKFYKVSAGSIEAEKQKQIKKKLPKLKKN